MEPKTATTTAQTPAARSFSIGEAIQFGWGATKSNLFFFIKIMVILVVVNAIGNSIGSLIPEDLGMLRGLLMFIVSIGVWALSMGMEIGMIKILLKFVDGQKGTIGDLFSYFDIMMILKLFVSSLMYALLIMVGFILLVIPGIIFLVRFSYYMYFIVDKNMGPVDALTKSWEITKGNTLLLIGFALVVFFINVAGALLLLIGLLVTIPLSMISAAYVYRKLSS